MATHRSLPRTLQLLVLGILNFGAVAVPSMIRQPIDQSETFSYGSSVSKRVTLSCEVHSTDPNVEGPWTIQWYKNGVQISTNQHVFFDRSTYGRYTIDFAYGGGYQKTNLQIETSAANAEYDSGNYQCRVFIPTLESRTARLDVFVTPQSGSVLCSISDDSQDDVFDVVSGNPITLVCRSDPTGVPEMTTDWKRVGFEGDTLETVTSTDPMDGWRIRSLHWTPTKAQNRATFICTGFHPANTRNTACRLGPFNVKDEPTATTTTASSTRTGPLLPTDYPISGSTQLPGQETLPSENGTTMTEHSSIPPNTTTVSKEYENIASSGITNISFSALVTNSNIMVFLLMACFLG